MRHAEVSNNPRLVFPRYLILPLGRFIPFSHVRWRSSYRFMQDVLVPHRASGSRTCERLLQLDDIHGDVICKCFPPAAKYWESIS